MKMETKATNDPEKFTTNDFRKFEMWKQPDIEIDRKKQLRTATKIDHAAGKGQLTVTCRKKRRFQRGDVLGVNANTKRLLRELRHDCHTNPVSLRVLEAQGNQYLKRTFASCSNSKALHLYPFIWFRFCISAESLRTIDELDLSQEPVHISAVSEEQNRSFFVVWELSIICGGKRQTFQKMSMFVERNDKSERKRERERERK